MPIITVNGIQINFPFEPYKCQLDYMSKVIESLSDGKHAILESPTGTGKTLCLLCAALAWQDHMKNILTNSVDEIVVHFKNTQKTFWNNSVTSQNKPTNNLIPKIIYSSRTHSQLSQCINALKKTSYSDRKVGMIASRDQLCINPKVMNLESNSAKIYGCKSKVKTRSCHFYNNFESSRDQLANETKIVDIEDLMTLGKQKSLCPYYLSRETFESADITFMPYNYLLDAKIRRLYNIDLVNSIVIFDEAHNIEQVCEDSASVELTSTTIACSIEELKVLGEYLFQNEMSESTGQGLPEDGENKNEIPNLTNVLVLKQNLLKLETNFHEIDLGSDSTGLTKGVDFLFDLMKTSGFDHSNAPVFREVIDQSTSFIGMTSDPKLHGVGYKGLEKIGTFFKTVFHDDLDDCNGSLEELQKILSRYYRVYIQENEIAKSTRNKINWDSNRKSAAALDKNRVLSYWCLSPGRTMKDLASCDVRSIILTSGTLYPVETVKTDMAIQFDVELRNTHVIQPDQMFVAVCTKGNDGESLNSSYETREKVSYLNSLGNSIVNLARVIPRGLLIVFPSYGMMKKCIDRWEACTIYSSIMKYKQLILEPQDKVKFSMAMDQFHEKNADPSSSGGAVLLAVARGKVSEGLDLSDHQGRGVIIVGLPYPAMMDPRIRLKMSFLDERLTLLKQGICGRDWYKQQAYRAVNQSVGRVIRHNRDFGAVFLCDERFATAVSRSQMPLWMQPNISIFSNFNEVIQDTAKFFRNVTIKYPPPSLNHKGSMVNYSAEIVTENIIVNVPKPVMRNYIADDDIPFSAQVMSFSTSLKTSNDAIAKTMEIYANYSGGKNTKLSEESTCLMDILKKAEKPSDVEKIPQKRSFMDYSMGNSSDKPVEKTKKYKLVDRKTSESSSKLGDYTKTLKELLAHDPDGFQSYKIAVGNFKKTENIDALFSSLNSLLCNNDRPGLVLDFGKFIRPEYQTRYYELCKSILGLECTAEKENTPKESLVFDNAMDCVHCLASPANAPLGAPCKHVCCFKCWKLIIDGDTGSKRCPKCSLMVRRKNLVRLTIS